MYILKELGSPMKRSFSLMVSTSTTTLSKLLSMTMINTLMTEIIAIVMDMNMEMIKCFKFELIKVSFGTSILSIISFLYTINTS